jgi:hypothetical protein
MSFDLATIGISALRRIGDLWRSGKSDSLIDYTRPTRVEPIVLIDTDCMNEECLHDLLQTLLSRFAGFYLQGVAISQQVGRIDVIKQLDKLNPHRNPGDALMSSGTSLAGYMLAEESYKFGLPTPGDTYAAEALSAAQAAKYAGRFSGADAKKKAQDEAEKVNNATTAAGGPPNGMFGGGKGNGNGNGGGGKGSTGNANSGNKTEKETFLEAMYGHDQGVSFGRDTLASLKELSNLAVGKMLAVELKDGNQSTTIPVSVRLVTSSLPSESLVHNLSSSSKDTSAHERYHGWKSGRLAFIRDIVLCLDVIEAHRRHLMADKDGAYTNILMRKRANQLATLVSGNPSVATASNMVIMSETTKAKIELEINGQIKDFKVREKLFEPTSLMFIVVIDKSLDRITFYSRGINEKTEVSSRELKMSAKSSGPDVSDILKAYSLGHSPAL